MSEDLHDIDKLFRDSLEAHEEMPSDKVWNALDNNLDKTNVIQIKRKYNNLKRLAVALLLLLLGTIIYEIQSKKQEGDIAGKGQEKNPISNGGKGNTQGGNATDDNAHSNTSSNKSFSNAGKDSLNEAEQQTTEATGINTTTKNDQHGKAETKHDQGNTDNNVPADAASNDNAGKSNLKKSSGNKTRMTIKNGTASEDDVVGEENGNEKKLKDVPGVFNRMNELIRPQVDKVETITARNQNDGSFKIDTKRISPDVDMATTKNKSLKNPKPFHFNVTAFYAPQFSFNRLEDDRHDPGPQGPQQGNGREEIKRTEPHEKAFAYGVLVEVPVGKKISVQSGVSYLNKTISIEPKKIYAKMDNNGKVRYRFDCSSGYTYIDPKSGNTPAVGDSVNAAASSNTLQYVGIPLNVHYTFSLGKFNIIPTVGTTANFLVKQKIETELIQGSSKEKQTINTIEGMKSTYFNASAGVALEYNVSKRIAVNVTPSGNFALSSINKNAAVRAYPNAISVGAGVKIKF